MEGASDLPEFGAPNRNRLSSHVQYRPSACRQFLLGAHRPDRPDNFVTKPPDRARTRPIRRTLQSKRGPSIEDLVPSGGLSWEGYRAGLKSIHQTGLTEVLQSYQPNIVLGGYPPPINTLERNLPRSARCTLAQLRSGYSLLINSYKSKIDPDTVDSCPDCAASPHSTSHLFDCPSNPTQLSAESLWRDPIAAAKLLRLEMGDLGETHKPPHKVTIRWMKRDVAVAGSSQRNEREDNTLLSQSAPRVDEETYQCIHRSVSLLHSF